MSYGKGANLEGTSIEFINDLDTLQRSNVSKTNSVLAVASNEMLNDLQGVYNKMADSKGDRGSSQARQLSARVYNTATLLPKAYQDNILDIMKTDLIEGQQLGRKAGIDLAGIIGDRSKVIDSNAKPNMPAIDQAGKRLADFWQKENTLFRDRVTSLTQNAAAQGMSYRRLALQIRELLALEKAQGVESRRSARLNERMGIIGRAELIARTELATAYVQGQIKSARENGYQWGRWSAAAERSCGYCISRDGLVYLLDDIEAAIPAHPRCRCTVIPADPPEDIKNKLNKENASDSLDDLYWTKSRKAKMDSWKKENRGIRDPKTDAILNGMLAKLAKTPTNTQKYFAPNAKAAEPVWMPSGSFLPDVAAAAAAQANAGQRQEEVAKKKADDKKRQDEEAEAKRKQLEAEAAKKQQEADEVKARQEKERRALEQAEKDRAALTKKLEAAEAKLAKAGDTAKRLELEKVKAKLKGELDVIEAKLAPIQKRLKELEARQAQLRKDAQFIKDMKENLRSAQADSEALSQRKGEAFLKKHGIESKARDLKQQLADAQRSSGKGKKFDLDEYDRKIARQNHDMATLKKIGEDVLRRAGTTLEKVKTPGSGPTAEVVAEAQLRFNKVKAELKALAKNLKTSKKNFETIDHNESLQLAALERQFERGDMGRQTYEAKRKDRKAFYERMRAREREYLEKHPDLVKSYEKRLKNFGAELAELKAKGGGPSGAQDVIDELMRTSPLTRKEAEALVKEAASPAMRKKNLLEGRSSGIKPVPKDLGLDDMTDAVQMYGTRSTMDRYGLVSERAHAHARQNDRKTGQQRFKADGYVNSGTGYSDFRGTQFHELGHHLEMQNSDFYRASRQFMKQRAEAGDGTIGSSMEIGSPLWLGLGPGANKNYGRGEVGYIMGKAYNPYVLKEYDAQRLMQYRGLLPDTEINAWEKATDYTAIHQKAGLATEVVSMGVEKLSSPSNMQRLAEMDSEHLLLSLGVVKVQQARAKNGIERFTGAQDTQAPVTTEAEIPNGSGDGKGADTAKLQKEIEKVEKEATKLKKDFDKITKEAEVATKKSSDLWDEVNKLRDFDDLTQEMRDLGDQVNDLRDRGDIERSKLFDKAKSVKDVEKQLEALGA